MDDFRYLLALLIIMGVPCAFAFWLSMHPLVRFWRRVGVRVTYSFHAALLAGVAILMFQLRDRLLRVDYGTHFILIALAIAVYFGAFLVGFQRRKGLSAVKLIGLPEVDPSRPDSQLVTDGIYSKVRHPRYLELMLLLVGHSFLSNYLAVYVALGAALVGFPLIIHFEEKELRDRFGRAHELYCAQVPRLIPKF